MTLFPMDVEEQGHPQAGGLGQADRWLGRVVACSLNYAQRQTAFVRRSLRALATWRSL
jgi:hypothetical protein